MLTLQLQKKPPEMPKMTKNKATLKENEEKSSSSDDQKVMKDAWQMWHKNGTRCPKGTVPIRRSTVRDVLRAKSLFDFGKKQRKFSLHRHSDAPDVVSGNGHEVN